MAGARPTSEHPSILVDARFIVGSGIARYLREVLSRLLRDERFGTIKLLGNPSDIRAFLGSADSGRVEIIPLTAGYYSPRAQLEWLAHRVRGEVLADAAFFPHYDAPIFLRHPRSVVTIQDLTHFMVPELFPAWKRRVASLVFNRVVNGAARVLVTSRSTQRDLVRRLPDVASRVRFIPLGVGSPFLGGSREVSDEARAQQPYLLFVGNRKPHKNLLGAVEALALLVREKPDLKLVLAGSSFPGWEVAVDRAVELGVSERVVEMTSVSDERLAKLYAGCEALLLPSLYEGFGLPALEAMACGAPVIGSDRASVPEVIGDAGLVVDATDPERIASAVRRIWHDPALRASLVQRGEQRAAQMTWDATANQTVDLLHRVATGTEVSE